MTSSHPTSFRRFLVFPYLMIGSVLFIGCGEVQKMADSVSEKVKSDFKKAKEELKEATGEVEKLTTDPDQNMTSPRLGDTASDSAKAVNKKPKSATEMLAEFNSMEPGRVGDAMILMLASNSEAASQITELKLSGNNPTIKSLEALSKFPNLERLTTARMKCLQGNMGLIGALKKLKYLNIEYNDLNDADFAEIDSLTNLEEINFGDTKITDAGFKHFSKLSKLRVMRLNKVPNLNGSGFSFVPKSNLKEIYAETSAIGQRAFESLGGVKSIEVLHLDRSAVSIEAMKDLARCTGLKKLSLQKNSLNDEGTKYLEKLKQLEELSLKGNPNVTSRSFTALSKIKSLKHLNVMDTKCLSKYEDEFLKRVPGCKILF